MLSGKSYQMMHNVIKKIKPNEALCYQRAETETNLSRWFSPEKEFGMSRYHTENSTF